MRVLYLQMFPLHGSGSGTYARELAIEVAKKHDVAIVTPDKNDIKNIKIYNIDLPNKIAFTAHPQWPDCVLYTKVSGKELAANYLSYFEGVVKAMNDFQPDIIHVHHLMPLAWIARFIKAAYKINFLVTAHGSELPTLENDKRYPYLTSEALSKSVKIVANSFWTKARIHQIFSNQFNKKMRVIPGAVDMANFPESMDVSSLDKKYGLKDAKLVFFSGKLTKYKGVRYLLQAAKNINAIVGIAGDGPERKNLENMAKELKLKNVKFFGYVGNGELIQLYYRADVCVVPSIWDEPLGLVVLEAMAAKTPVVVTRKGGIPLMVKDGHNGFFVRPRNAREIKERVNELLADDTKRLKMGQNAKQTVLEKFTWDIIAAKYERIYAQYRKKEIPPGTMSNSGILSKIFERK